MKKQHHIIPFRKLHDLNLALENFWVAKTFISNSEHLNISEQKLYLLKRINLRQVFTAFIRNNAQEEHLLPMKITTGIDYHVKHIQIMLTSVSITFSRH